MTKKIILDCDPGHDDALAMTLAVASPKIELLALAIKHQTRHSTTPCGCLSCWAERIF